MSNSGYTIPGSLNFKRLKNTELVSTNLETRSNQQASLGVVDQVRRFKCVEGFLNHKLYDRYASSQNYYYLRDINQIMGDERAHSVILIKDLAQFDTLEELMKKQYKMKDYKGKMQQLCEYYKFHKEIPRMFAKEIYDTFFDHHDKKRKSEYLIITRKLKEEAGENLKAQMEEHLKKMRMVKFEPFLVDLGPLTKIQNVQVKKEQRDLKKPEANDSIISLQNRLNKIFSNNDQSFSDLQMKTFVEEGSVSFVNTFGKSMLGTTRNQTNGAISTVNATPNTSQSKQKFTISSVVSSALVSSGGTLRSTNRFLTTNTNQGKTTKDLPESSLRKISLPANHDGRKKEDQVYFKRTDSERKAPIYDLQKQEQSTRGPSSRFGQTQTEKIFKKSLTREPSLTTTRNKSSHSIKRGLTLPQKNANQEPYKKITLNSKREASDFRITKKQTLEIDSPNKASPTERQEAYLIRDEKGEGSSARGAGNWLSSKNGPASTKRNTFMEGSNRSLKRSMDFGAIGLTNKSPNEAGPNNLKVDIERLLKASGLMDLRTSRPNVTREAATTVNSIAGSKHHKYTKSGPETLIQLNLHTARPSNVTALQISEKNTAFQSKVRLTSNEKERISKGKGIMLEKKISVTEPKMPFVESSTYNQPVVKLVKKSSNHNVHHKKASSRF